MKKDKFTQRRKRVRAKIKGSQSCPRLSVFRSNKFIYAQIIDDCKGKTLVSASSKDKEVLSEKDIKRIQKAQLLGEILAKKAITKKIKNVLFDKSGYKYHGIVKALAEGARKGGLKF